MTSVVYMIHNKLTNFSKAEQKVGRYILDHTNEVIQMSTAELATAAGVSTATVARFGQVIMPDGGYPALKLRLSAEGNVDQTLYDEINPQDSLEAIKSKLSMRMAHTVEETSRVLSDKALRAANQLIAEKSSIYLYGLGASDVVATDFEQKYIRVGKAVIHSQDTHLLAVGMTTQAAQSVLFLVSNSGEKSESIQLAKLAKAVKVPVIALTRNATSTLGSLADVVLINDDSEENQTARAAATTSVVAQLYVVDLLYYTFIANDYDQHIKQLVSSRSAINKHFN
ncbi:MULTISPECIES: MurR/RpiR family transcriptional regulator [Lactiplantibacillus]|uniref:MurR/RpiR family transcriptional regulator n=5 Tax=Lactiplantibacillus TaxID=2767842 RepID=A0AAP8VCJ9_LACPE|nr:MULTISPECIES: MurR/RpiR family transcriptional regulator [Lactiplantibacillus]POD89069.1 putative HTH-type transcriptional regulator YbbH [Lactiplantibacillus plantarum subsp. plantarum]CCC17241.1 transcription regulator [Lactiplantibacillus pentosus IG1]AUI80059.1 RpiR family transcriptional regulator [Lactiplantibacillus pentosus]AYG38693.1 MurR/RpiR family transcriptional regulator [Lactiplantibacillus pentosus]AYG41353.1 MurR/RpiR family transcriptional regulator [Lactiplantibacillus pe